MEVGLIIQGRFPSLNDYIAAERRNRHIAAKMKREETKRVSDIAAYLDMTFEKPVHVYFTWAEPNKRRDIDNIAFAHKFILDGLVDAGVLKGDSQKYVTGFVDRFRVDKDNPHVSILITDEYWE